MARGALFGACAILAACGAGDELRVIDLPPLMPGTQSVVVVFESEIAPRPPDQSRMLRAYSVDELSSTAWVIELDEDPLGEVHLLQYSIGLGALDLDNGPIELAGAEGRALPDPDGVLAWAEPNEGGWREVPLPDRMRLLRVRQIDPSRCLEREGCLDVVGDAVTCNLACDPGPEPTPPIPPVEATSPSILRSSCGATAETLLLQPLELCDPRPSAIACGPSEAQPAGRASCVPLDARPCPRFAELMPGARPIYVDAASPAGGDGQLATPLRTITEAALLSQSGQVIVVAAGAYPDPVILDGDRSLVGACAEATLVGPIVHRGSGLLAGVRIGGPASALVVEGGANIVVERVAIDPSPVGIELDSGRAEIRGVVIRGAQTGIDVKNGARLDLSRAYVEDASVAAINVAGIATTATISEVVVRGGSVLASGGAAVTLDRVVIEGSRGRGLGALGASTVVEANDVVIMPAGGGAIWIEDESRLIARRLQISGAVGAGITLESAEASIEDLVIEDLRPRSASPMIGRAIHLLPGGRLELARARLERVPSAGIEIEAGASAVVSDLVAVEITTTATGGGVLVRGGRIELERARIEGSLFGVRLDVSQSFADGRDLDFAVDGAAIAFLAAGTTFLGARIATRGGTWGLTGASDSLAEVTDLRVSDLRGSVQGGSGISGNGLTQLTVDRFIIEDAIAPAVDLDTNSVEVGQKRFSHGRIRRNAIAMRLPQALGTLLLTYDRVVFEDNVQLFGSE